jgi:RNA polymerase sigma-70 factor (ECF subfamily)
MDDKQIIDLYMARSEDAIKETDTKYGKLCRRLAINILSNKEDAEECVNDTYLGTWNAIPPQLPLSLCAFICRITRNLALKKYEYLSAKRRNPEVNISLTELEDCVSGADTVEDAIENERIGKAISDFLRTLDDTSKNVFLRRYWFYDSIPVIAEQFSISDSKTTSMLFRTRKKLQVYLKKEGIEL